MEQAHSVNPTQATQASALVTHFESALPLAPSIFSDDPLQTLYKLISDKSNNNLIPIPG
jgi:hypothetical protein